MKPNEDRANSDIFFSRQDEPDPDKTALRSSNHDDQAAAEQPVGPNGPFLLRGRQGKTLRVDGDTVTIEKQGLVGRRDKAIPIRNITSVEVKKPGPLVVGFIQFSIAGGFSRDSSYKTTGGAFDAVTDENSVVFAHMPEYETALRIKSYIESWGAVPANAEQHAPTAADELRQLKSLVDEGILTTQEFEQKKKQLLGL